RNRAPQWGHWPALPFRLGGPLSLWPLGQRKTKTSPGEIRFLPLPIAGVIREPLISTELPPPTAVVDSLGTTNGALHLGHLPDLPARFTGAVREWPLGHWNLIIGARNPTT